MTQSRRSELAGQRETLQVVQISFGFDRSHPKVWQYFRDQGLLVVSVSRAPERLKPFHIGQRVMVYIPKSQGGFGLVGIGILTGDATTFEKAGTFLNDPVGSAFRAHMQEIYTDESNRPSKGKSCFNKQFKCHRDRLGKCEVQTTPWDYGVRWRSDKEWLQKRQNPDGYYVHYPVKWEATVPFEDGFLHVDWQSFGLSPIRLPSLSSIVPRYFTQLHLDVLMSLLRGKGEVSSASASGKQSTTVVRQRRRVQSTLKRPAAASANMHKCAKKSHTSCQAVSKHEKLDVANLLLSLGIAEYIPQFHKEKVDLDALKLLSDADFISLGLPLGPRRKVQAALKRID